MLRLLRSVSLRDYRAAPVRLALMIGGIAAGVALIAALGIINASVLSNFRASLERAAGKAALQVVLGTGEVGFEESALATVKEDPQVENAFGLVRGWLAATDDSGDTLQLFGVDLTTEAMDSYDVRAAGEGIDELEFLNDPTSVLLTEEYATRRGITVDDHVEFATPKGLQRLRVRGLLRAEGLATIFAGNLAVMDLPAAQRLLGKEGRVDQVDVLLPAGADVTAVRDRLAAALPSSLSVIRPALRGERFERVIGAFQAMLDGLSLLCLLAGVFIVYNTTATAVMQRARDLAIMLVVGAERRRIFLLVLTEAAIIGLVASILGVLIGLGMARLLLHPRRAVDGGHLPDPVRGRVVHAHLGADRVVLRAGARRLDGGGAGPGAQGEPSRSARADATRLPRASGDHRAERQAGDRGRRAARVDARRSASRAGHPLGGVGEPRGEPALDRRDGPRDSLHEWSEPGVAVVVPARRGSRGASRHGEPGSLAWTHRCDGGGDRVQPDPVRDGVIRRPELPRVGAELVHPDRRPGRLLGCDRRRLARDTAQRRDRGGSARDTRSRSR